jgi:hypothetical protein
VTSPGYKLAVADDFDGHVANFYNDGNNTNRQGIRIQCGTDDNSGVNTLVTFCDGNGTTVGNITATGGVVSYNGFSGSHAASIPQEKNQEGYPYGTLMSLIATRHNPERPRQSDYEVAPSRQACDTAVFGGYAGKDETKENLHQINAVGDGHILVCQEGGDIRIGDFLASSNREGHAMKQADGLLHNFTIARALESVSWEKETVDTKLIPCSYKAQ